LSEVPVDDMNEHETGDKVNGKIHQLHIRDLDDDTYEKMWNLRKKKNAKSWADLMRIVCGEYMVEVKQEWK
jgi:hypothetical protein